MVSTARNEISCDAEQARNRVASAEALYRDVLEQFPEHIHALRGLADTHLLKGLLEAVERQDVNSEEWSIIEAATKAQAENFIEAAKSYLADGFPDKSEQMLMRALEYDPDNSELLWRRGEIYRAMGHFTTALDAYGRILAFDPENEAAAYATNMLAANSAPLDNAGAHWARAEAYRGEGNLDAAMESYRCLLEQNPDNAAARYIHAILAGDAPVEAPPDFMPRPVPFVVIDNFLSAEEHDAILLMTEGLLGNFEPSTVGTGERQSRDIDKRKSRLIKKIDKPKFVNWFVQQITDTLSNIRPKLYIDEFNICVIDLQITAHHDGDFYTKHLDVGKAGSGIERRKISVVYYYHWQPKAFEGGDLLLYDSIKFTELDFTRIAPVDNRIIFFPSDYWHEVTPVHCQENNFKSGRFTLNGWVRDGH